MFSVIYLASVMFSCSKAVTPDVLTYSSKKMYGISSIRQDLKIVLDQTLSVEQQKKHEDLLIEYIYLNEFDTTDDITKLTINELGVLLDLRDSLEYADKRTNSVFSYYTEYKVKPGFVNDRLTIYEVLHNYYQGGLHSSQRIYYCFLDKNENTLLDSPGLFKKTQTDLDGLNELLRSYLLSYVSARYSLSADDPEGLKALGFWGIGNLCHAAVYSFSQNEMICVFNETTIGDISIGIVTLKIPTNEVRPFLSDHLRDLLFDRGEI